jgi:hypothetical protein
MAGDAPRERPWGFVLTIGAIAVVGILLLVVPGMLAPTPETTPRPSPTPDPHVVVTDAGTIVFGFEDGSIVVRRTTDAVTTELGRIPVAPEWRPVTSGGPLNGAAVYAMVCPAASDPAGDRFLLGYIGFGSGMTYRGPGALGQGAPDGLYLFALPRGDLDPAALLEVSSSGGGVGVGANYFELALTEGEEQPSGCRVYG